MCEVVSKNIALKKKLFKKKKTLFSNMCTFLSHCFEMKNYHCIHMLNGCLYLPMYLSMYVYLGRGSRTS